MRNKIIKKLYIKYREFLIITIITIKGRISYDKQGEIIARR